VLLLLLATVLEIAPAHDLEQEHEDEKKPPERDVRGAEGLEADSLPDGGGDR